MSENESEQPKTTVEILSGALALWGPNGEHWCQWTLKKTCLLGGDFYCLIGGLNQVAAGKVEFFDRSFQSAALMRAKELIREKTGIANIASKFNDRSTFAEVRAVVCAVLKDELEKEEACSKPSSSSDSPAPPSAQP